MNSAWDSSSPLVKMTMHGLDASSADLHLLMPQEGQLSVDVLETPEDIVVISTLAGADVDTIDVAVHNDLLTIRGARPEPTVSQAAHKYFHKECFWGKFSRTIVLPVDVKSDLAQAEYKNGVLTVTIPKQRLNTRIPVIIVD